MQRDEQAVLQTVPSTVRARPPTPSFRLADKISQEQFVSVVKLQSHKPAKLEFTVGFCALTPSRVGELESRLAYTQQ